jgi:prolipoprotein diacylglyceryltransferase
LVWRKNHRRCLVLLCFCIFLLGGRLLHILESEKTEREMKIMLN